MKQLLIDTLKVQSETYNSFRMFAYIIRFLTKNNIPFYVYDGSIYATKGDGKMGYPCVISHTDTVHDIVSNLTVYETGDGNLFAMNNHTMEQIGIGGDDKVGIFMCLQLLTEIKNLKCVFFRDEETGCVGSSNVHKHFFKDVNFVLQHDRKGREDFVTNAAGEQLSGKDFQQTVKPILKKYGYKFQPYGGLTDVAELKSQGINIAMANISCGYYNPHSDKEYVNIADVFNVYEMSREIILTYGGRLFKHKIERPKTNVWGLTSKVKNIPLDTFNFCDGCGDTTISVSYTKQFNAYLCKSCKPLYK